MQVLIALFKKLHHDKDGISVFFDLGSLMSFGRIFNGQWMQGKLLLHLIELI